MVKVGKCETRMSVLHGFFLFRAVSERFRKIRIHNKELIMASADDILNTSTLLLG